MTRACTISETARRAAATVHQMRIYVASLLEPGDIIVDDGNSYYVDDLRWAKELARLGLHYVDVGTSGGVFGLERGYCQMFGGEVEAVARLEPIFAALAPSRESMPPTLGRDGKPGTAELGYLHCGAAFGGHGEKR